MSTNEEDVNQPEFRAATPPPKVEQRAASRPDEATMRRMRSPFSVDAANEQNHAATTKTRS